MRVIAETVSFDTSRVWLWHIFNQLQCQMEHDSITFDSSDMKVCVYSHFDRCKCALYFRMGIANAIDISSRTRISWTEKRRHFNTPSIDWKQQSEIHACAHQEIDENGRQHPAKSFRTTLIFRLQTYKPFGLTKTKSTRKYLTGQADVVNSITLKHELVWL